jgi:hypothetical protein
MLGNRLRYAESIPAPLDLMFTEETEMPAADAHPESEVTSLSLAIPLITKCSN